MSKPSLTVGDIYCALSSRGDGSFHWALAIPMDTKTAVKIHATNPAGTWKYEATDRDISHSETICVLVKIGVSAAQYHTFPISHVFLGRITSTNTVDRICKLLEPIPMEVPTVFKDSEPKFTCRVWVKEACRVMDAMHIIKCSNVVVLEKEILGYGNDHDAQTVMGLPYKVYTAKSST